MPNSADFSPQHSEKANIRQYFNIYAINLAPRCKKYYQNAEISAEIWNKT